jgi:mitochondrial fission protein ELM1
MEKGNLSIPQSPLVIWRLTDGTPGHMQQTLGLARALTRLTPCEIIDIDLVAQPVGWRDFFLGRFRPGVAKKRPQLIIGAGHSTHFGLLAARKSAGGRSVALMKPSLPLSLFDFVVAPMHDGLQGSERVINTQGVLNPMQTGEKKSGSLLFLIGGPSKHVRWDDVVILQQIGEVAARLQPGADWRVTDSRRTPDSLRVALQQEYGERFQSFSQCPPGWLADRLLTTEIVWVTEESVSMIYEALTAGCRVGLLQLPDKEHGSRVMQGIQRLVSAGMVMTFTDWQHTGNLRAAHHFNEANRVAALLLKRMGILA